MKSPPRPTFYMTLVKAGEHKVLLIDTLHLKIHHQRMETTNFESIDTTWIENIALEEINMDESGVINMDSHLDTYQLLEEESIEFMNQIKDRVELFICKFNQYRSSMSSGHQVKIFKISNTVNDFMLFRNSLRLIISRKANDLITIGFLSSGNDLLSPRLSSQQSSGNEPAHEIRAHVGAFNKISWLFQGSSVDVDAMVRHYVSEFLKQSAR